MAGGPAIDLSIRGYVSSFAVTDLVSQPGCDLDPCPHSADDTVPSDQDPP